MRQSRKVIIAILALQTGLLAFHGAAQAQQAHQKAAPLLRTPQATEQPSAKAQDRVGLSPAATQSTLAAVAPPSPEVTNFDGWTVTCVEQGPDNKKKTCVAKMVILKSQEDSRPILIVNIIKTADVLTFALQTPTGIDLKPGVNLEIGKSAQRRLEYVSCEPALCTAAINWDEKLAQELAASPSAVAKWTGLTVGEVKVEYALKEAKQTIAYLGTR